MDASLSDSRLGPAMPRDAVLLIAHGSRRDEANRDLTKIAALVAQKGHFEIVQVSYLELAKPTILEGGRDCIRLNATRVLMQPYFLSAGVHVATDLEAFREQLAA